jgi:hypothetical protein
MEVGGGVIETSLLWLVGQANIFCYCPEVAVLFLFSLLDLLLHSYIVSYQEFRGNGAVTLELGNRNPGPLCTNQRGV